mmetsp:Transcript_12911/g.27876  ORF Transcript_12911/g.27876 Transcript_12911/m.27876 type:complete len:867 (+) Transcript_12911:75-2675(+)
MAINASSSRRRIRATFCLLAFLSYAALLFDYLRLRGVRIISVSVTQQLEVLRRVENDNLLLGTGVGRTPAITTNGGYSRTTGRRTEREWDSAKCAVIGLAVGYGRSVFERFVGSLRATGYAGSIILGIAPDASDGIRSYLSENNVTTKEVRVVKKDGCTYYNTMTVDGIPSSRQVCSEEYPDYKIQWGRFPLSRDWLNECKDCTDGVMLTDVRDVYFQSDPFAFVTSPHELMLFEEIFPGVTNEHWLTDLPVKKCRNVTVGPVPVLCSGSTMGTREGIINYIQVMVEEFDYWKARVNCRCDMVGDDQSIHNYLYYTNRFGRDTVTIKHRTGPIHVVGKQASGIVKRLIKRTQEDGHGQSADKAEEWIKSNMRHKFPYDMMNERELSEWQNLTDLKTGHVLNLDGVPSPQIHQTDRFGVLWEAFFQEKLNRLKPKVLNEPAQKSSPSRSFSTPLLDSFLEEEPDDSIREEFTDSIKILLSEALKPRPVWDDDIDPGTEEERCERYGFKYDPTVRSTRRRVFWGTMIADESWHTIGIHSMESYGIFHTAALVESSMTHNLDNRTMRFLPGSTNLKLLQSGMFGPETAVHVDYYHPDVESQKKVGPMTRENLHRNRIVDRWRKNGMRADDIGLVTDVDEVLTRDFLRAVQICEIEEFKPNQSCKNPKLLTSTIVIETSPMCVRNDSRWFHPDMVIGECIELIGDPAIHKPLPIKPNRVGFLQREDNWTSAETEHYPLWTASEIRQLEAPNPNRVEGKHGLHTAYHFHNFFTSITTYRNKYLTYCHPRKDAMTVPLGKLQDNVGVFADCALGRRGDERKYKSSKEVVEGGWTSLDEVATPVAFAVGSYADMRHREATRMVAEDERANPPP